MSVNRYDVQPAKTKLLNDFDSFLSTTNKNQRLYYGNYTNVYVRRSVRFIYKRKIECIDIATINIAPYLRGKGLGTSLIESIHNHHPYPATFIENVINENLYTALKRREWQEVEHSIPPSFLKIK